MLKIQREFRPQPLTSLIVLLVSFVAALSLGAIILYVAGYDPIKVYTMTYPATFFTWEGISENLVVTTPLILCALSVAVPAKAGIWNIGIDGQFYLGAVAATALALTYPHLSPYILIPLMIIVAAISAGFLAIICVLPKVFYGVSEITIMPPNVKTRNELF